MFLTFADELDYTKFRLPTVPHDMVLYIAFPKNAELNSFFNQFNIFGKNYLNFKVNIVMKLKVNSTEQVTQTRLIATENKATNIFCLFCFMWVAFNNRAIVKFDTFLDLYDITNIFIIVF